MPGISPQGYDRVKAAILGGERRRLGKYVLGREAGRGGMAVVYEAQDLELRRRVALKVVRQVENAEQFLREARIAAQLRHPNIVAVHDAGQAHDGVMPVHYLAMDFVDGRTLSEILAARTETRERLLDILEQVAAATEFAHSKGVVHRDIKPGNVLVDANGRAFLSDFGLARAQAMTTLMQQNTRLGTPAYMAPEQVHGDPTQMGPVTDVWALGVVLYEILTGSIPFNESNPAELYRQISSEQPMRPGARAANVPRDLEIICLKALEKDTSRRYPSAKEFAADLARFRRREPIAARPPTLAYRLSRSVARRKGVVSGGLGALVLATTAALIARSCGDDVTQLQRRADTALKAALELRRAGRLDSMQTFSKETDETCREAIARDPDIAEPHYLLGRMRRALMDDDGARHEQNLALDRDAGHAGARYERIVLTVGLYRQRLEDLSTLEFRARDADDPARKLRAAIESDAAMFGGDGARRDIVQGTLAWLAGDSNKAKELLTAARSKSPDLEEAISGLALIALDERRFDESITCFTEGIARDLGFVPYFEGRAIARLTLGMDRAGRGEDPTALFDAALKDCEEALAKAPGRTEAVKRRGMAHFLTAHFMAKRGVDPRSGYAKAIEDWGKADARMWRGVATVALATARSQRGEDAGRGYEDALADLDVAVARNGAGAEAWMYRGIATFAHARNRQSLGDKADVLFAKAVTDLDEAVKRGKSEPDPWMWRAMAHAARSNFNGAYGDFEEALKLAPERAEIWSKRAQTRGSQMREQAIQNLDPVEADFREAIKRNPRAAEAWLGLGYVELARKRFGEAIPHIDKGIECDGDEAGAHYTRGLAFELAQEPRKAIKDYDEALKLNPSHKQAREHLTRCRELVQSNP